jgi:hypothetical protein
MMLRPVFENVEAMVVRRVEGTMESGTELSQQELCEVENA